MRDPIENFSRYAKDFAGSGLDSVASLSKSAEAIAAEASDYTSKVFETGNAVLGELLAASSLEDAIAIQSSYFKQSYEGFVAEATKIGNLYAELAGGSYRPFETIGTKAR